MIKILKKRTIEFIQKTDTEEIPENQRIPMAKCREILNENGKKYTDEQIQQIRDWLYHLASTAYDEYIIQQPTIIIPLTQRQNNEHEKSHYLRAG